MFNKSKSPSPADAKSTAIPPLPDIPAPAAPRAAQPSAPAPAAATPGRGLSTLSADLNFEGNVSGGGDLQIDGQIKGDVRVGRLIVGETGAVDGNVSADYIEIRGRVQGAVTGKQVKLVSTAYVDGDITAEQLSIDVGAYFQGRCIQGRRDAAPAPKPAPAAQPAAAPTQPAPTQPATQTISMSN
ncbi:bactofilin family protein [Brevundimonas fluminis]|uniref:bactofilin family protein n=1 Tax=Brevundimonas fluminis TaxID=2487274 RepID=UPI000F65733D|nr:polymer-forming cytoskeletal protein [Brevundimonas fluminis]